MSTLDKTKKSNQLLGGQRNTHAELDSSFEAFSEVLDLRTSEIYSQAHLIPTSSYLFYLMEILIL